MELTRPIFITGCHKSGTSLLRSLLDGHPEIDFVYPNELHFFRAAGYRMEYPIGASFRPPSDFAEFARNALKLIEPAVKGNKAFARFGPHAALTAFRSDLFLDAMNRKPVPTDALDQMLRYLDATSAALGYDLGRYQRPVRIVEKSVSNIEFAAALKHLFPNCRIIHVLRNPYANIVAIRRAKRGPDTIGALRSFIRAIGLSFCHALTNREAIPDFHVVLYEDFLEHPEALAKDLCSRLGLGYSPSLLATTVLGEPWGGNSSSGRDFGSRVSQHPLHQWKKHITDIEIRLVNRSLSKIMTRVGYDVLSSRRHWIVPETNESPSAYLSNRLFLHSGPGKKQEC